MAERSGGLVLHAKQLTDTGNFPRTARIIHWISHFGVDFYLFIEIKNASLIFQIPQMFMEFRY